MNSTWQRRALGALLTFGYLACGERTNSTDGRHPVDADGGPASTEDAGADPVARTEWKACDLVPGTPGAECVKLAMPVDHARGGSDTLEVGVKRVGARLPPKAQVWLVEGGPGGSGVNALAANARTLRTTRRDVEVLAIDHRGVGGSVPLDCPEQESASSVEGAGIAEVEWADCVSSLRSILGARLDQLTTTNSARDLGVAVERLRRPGVPVFVYGISYGSYVVLRYLKYFPDQPSDVVVEGIVPPDLGFDGYDSAMNEKAKELFELCRRDTKCVARLGPDPWATAASVVASIDGGHCPALGLDTDGARAFLGGYLAHPGIRDYLPLLVYRMQRCNARDVAALAKFYATLSAFGVSFKDGKTVTLPAFFHVALSEMWPEKGLPFAEVEEAWRKTVMSTGLSVRVAARRDGWPVYSRASIDTKLPAYAGPLLMLQGRLDPAAPVEAAARLRDAYTSPNQAWVEFPYGAHAVYSGTPMPDGTDCGEKILFQFIDHPDAPIDTSCTAATVPPGFGGSPSQNVELLGVTEGWDG